MKKLIRVLALIVCIAMLSSVLFVTCAAGHDCAHEDCAICYHIRVCVNMLKSFALVISVLAVMLAARSAVLCAAFEKLPYYVQSTPVSNKVKLSN